MTRTGMCTIIVLLGSIVGCSGNLQKTLEDTLPSRDAEYKSSRSLPTLEVPPDLTSPTMNDTMAVPETGGDGTTTYSEYSNSGLKPKKAITDEVLPVLEDIRVERTGDKRWLVIGATPSQIWPRLKEFWLQNGFLIKVEDPSIGIMETDWAENRADIPRDFIRTMLEKISTALYSAATRDKFRIRLERGTQPGTTEIYVSHRGAEEVTQNDSFVWQPRPSDPELEAEMLNRMMVFFGVKREQAQQMIATRTNQAPKAQVVRDRNGVSSLSLQEEFSRAWRRTGLALDRVGFTVEDRDRSRGLFFVRYVDPLKESGEEKGWLSKLKFWGKDEKPNPDADEYLISLRENGNATQVVVLDKSGQQDNGSTANRILSLLHEQLK